MQFVRKSKYANEPDSATRIAALQAELELEISEGGISIFRFDDSTIGLVGALFCVGCQYPCGFPYFVMSEELLGEFGANCIQIEDESLPFAFMQKRHFEIKSIRDLNGFVAKVGLKPEVLPKGATKKRAQEERQNLTVTTDGEWATAGEWTKPGGPKT